MEIVSITALVIGIVTAVAALLTRLKFKKCHMGCIDSDCVRTPQNTPRPSIIITNFEDLNTNNTVV
jgi:hypothetical protein